MRARPRALVTDAEHRSALAVCRSLAAAGYHVTAASGARPACAHWSRSVHGRLGLPSPSESRALFVTRLAAALGEGSFDVLVPSTDASLLAVSEHRSQLEPLVRIGLPPHDDVLRALDKQALLSAAAGTALAGPRSTLCDDEAAALAAARETGFPVAVKPQRSLLEAGEGLRQVSARIVHTEADLTEAIHACGLPLCIQEALPDAQIVSCAGARIDGALAAVAVARYARTHPAAAGSASMAVTIDPPAGLVEGIEEILGQLGWEGIFEIELLEAGGRLATIDLNPRPFGWLALAIAAGADLPAVWCDHLLGRPARGPAAAHVGVRYRWEVGEALTVLTALRRGRLHDAVAPLRPYRRVVHPEFRVTDPGPLAARAIALLRGRLRLPARPGVGAPVAPACQPPP